MKHGLRPEEIFQERVSHHLDPDLPPLRRILRDPFTLFASSRLIRGQFRREGVKCAEGNRGKPVVLRCGVGSD